MVTINIGRKAMIFFSAVILIFLVGGLSVAYNSGAPADIMGHDAGELEGVCLSDGTNCPASIISGSSAKVLTLGDPRAHSNYRTTCVILEDKSVWCWGNNGHREMGIGQEASDRYLPEHVPLPSGAASLAVGHRTNYALLDNGQVYVWGYNGHGQLGYGSTTARYTPQRASGLTNVIQIVASQANSDASSSCALKSDGTVWCWGYNGYGQLGDGTTTNRYTPVQVSGLTNAIDLDMSGGQYANVCALKSDATVWCWGYNGHRMLGDGTTTNRYTPVQVSGLTNVVNTTSTAIGSVGHRCALKSDATVWCWGDNNNGQLGDGTVTDRATPVRVSGLTTVKSITLGGGQESHGSTFAILNDNTIRSWGYNGYGQLGDGTTTRRTTPVNPGLSNVKQVVLAGTGTYTTTSVLLNDGTVRNMGYNGHGAVGDGTQTTRTSPLTVLGLTGVEVIWARGQSNEGYFCALLSNGRLKCWGYNGNGQLGNGNVRATSVPTYVRL